MTLQPNNDNGSKGRTTEHQAVGGIFYCRVGAGFNVSASNKLSCNLIPQVRAFEIGNKNISSIRYVQP